MNKFTKKEFLLFLFIFLLGAFLRIYHSDYPLGLHGDEAWTGIEARRILSEGSIGFWSPGAIGQPSLPFYWTAVIFKYFGISIESLRISFSIIEIVSLPFFYLTCRLLFNKKVAIISFMLFITARIPLHFSHIAYSAYNAPIFPAIYFLVLSLKEKKIRYYFLSGLFLGLAPYFYPGLRLLPIIFITYFSVTTFSQHAFIKELPKFIITLLIAISIFSPLGLYYINHPDSFFVRSNMVSVFSKQGIEWAKSTNANLSTPLSLLSHNATAILFMFNKEGDHDSQDNNTRLPILDIASGIFFIVGFLFQLRYIRKKEYSLLYFLFLLFLSGTLLTVDAPNFRRIQPSIAVSYIFVGFGILNVSSILMGIIKNKYIINSLIISVVIFIGYLNIKDYFLIQAVSAETKSIFCYQLVRAASFIKTVPNPYVYFYSSRWAYDYEPLRFLLNGVPGEDRSPPFGIYSLIKNNNSDKTVVYLFLPDYQNSFFEIQKMYPNGKIIIEKDTDGSVLFYSYIIPK